MERPLTFTALVARCSTVPLTLFISYPNDFNGTKQNDGSCQEQTEAKGRKSHVTVPVDR
jgi:hypothetical protein